MQVNITIKSILDELIENIKTIYGEKLKEIVLYGSYAKELEDEESDIDIVVLLNLDDAEMRKYNNVLNEIVSEISYKSMKVISLVDISYDKFINWVNVVPFYKNVLNEGVVLYGR
jgi:predicted nucleotidyltransferase